MTATNMSSPIAEVKTTTTRNFGAAPTPLPPSRIPLLRSPQLYCSAFPSDRPAFNSPPFDELLIYQLHVGSFSGHNDGLNVRDNTATFLDLISKLDYIRNLGFNAIQLLLVNTEQGSACGAGELYGPSDLYAIADVYATDPSKAVVEFIQLIDPAHSKGLAIILDVIYAHAGNRESLLAL
jgi:pullulanase/glycogen debranching enzyme